MWQVFPAECRLADSPCQTLVIAEPPNPVTTCYLESKLGNHMTLNVSRMSMTRCQRNAPFMQARPPDAAPPHHMVLDFEPGQTAYDVDAMESPAEHSDAADARQRRKAGPAPVTLISCLEASFRNF